MTKDNKAAIKSDIEAVQALNSTVSESLIEMLMFINGGFQLLGSYITLSALQIKAEYDNLRKMKTFLDSNIPFAKNNEGSILMIGPSKSKGMYDGIILELDMKGQCKTLCAHFGMYIEGMRDNLLLKKVKYDEKAGIISTK